MQKCHFLIIEKIKKYLKCPALLSTNRRSAKTAGSNASYAWNTGILSALCVNHEPAQDHRRLLRFRNDFVKERAGRGETEGESCRFDGLLFHWMQIWAAAAAASWTVLSTILGRGGSKQNWSQTAQGNQPYTAHYMFQKSNLYKSFWSTLKQTEYTAESCYGTLLPGSPWECPAD